VKLGDTAEPPPPTNTPPTASFLAGCSFSDCLFADRSSDAEGNIAAWAWDFGDGASETSRDPSHTYAEPGRYTARLTVHDAQGASGTFSRQITVPGPEFPIEVSATGNATATEQNVTLTWSGAQGPSMDVYRDGEMLTSTANDGTHTVSRSYTDSITYVFKVCEAATTICSNEVSVVFSDSPTNVAPVADFTSTCTGRTCSFTDRSTDADGTLSVWSWTFGDGGTSTAPNPSRTYTAAGTYTVALGVTDDGGATNTRSASVTAFPIALTATGREDAEKQYMILTWTGAVGATMDIYRNGVRVVTGTPNDGKQGINKKFTGPATYVLKICQGGSTICSNEVTLVFD
jgi:PKD repeat protein